MSVPTHIKVTVRGHFNLTPETWSFGFHLSRENGAAPDADYAEIDIDAMATAVSTWVNSSNISSAVKVDDVRAYVIGTNGKMQGNGPKIHTFGTPFPTGSGFPHSFPPQIAVAVTSVAVNRGPAKLGRMYFPGPSQSLGTDGRLTTSGAQGYIDMAAQLVKDCSNAVDLDLANSSKGLNISEGPAGSPTGTSQEIDHYECGRVLDTLRNRRKSMLEERVIGGHIDW